MRSLNLQLVEENDRLLEYQKFSKLLKNNSGFSRLRTYLSGFGLYHDSALLRLEIPCFHGNPDGLNSTKIIKQDDSSWVLNYKYYEQNPDTGKEESKLEKHLFDNLSEAIIFYLGINLQRNPRQLRDFFFEQGNAVRNSLNYAILPTKPPISNSQPLSQFFSI